MAHLSDGLAFFAERAFRQGMGIRPGKIMKFVVIQELGDRWVWELRSADGQPVCRSATAFTDREQVFRAIHAVRGKAPGALVFDPLGTLYQGV
ncbi:DUF1508 domain-containing protein [Variovorax guangxiensis]|nr:DUF1508 domain-containing protein [Variovorax guangxiensis]